MYKMPLKNVIPACCKWCGCDTSMPKCLVFSTTTTTKNQITAAYKNNLSITQLLPCYTYIRPTSSVA